MLLPTNGLMPELIRRRTEEIILRCPRSVVTVKLSIDSLGDRHDDLRGVPGAFGKVIETYESLAPLLDEHRNFEMGVNTVFSAANQDEMDHIIEFVQGMDKVRTHTVSLVRGELADEGLKDVDMTKYLRAVERLEGGLKDGTQPVYGFRGARIKAAQDIVQRRLINRTVRENRRQIPCYAGRLNLTLTETGDVYPCEDFSEEWRLGNVRDFACKMDSLVRSRHARGIIGRIARECFCTHECYMMTNILFNPATYPLLLAETARLG
jgi:radical SAM protein with 4Fe4S-binding SPASM domain